jgi:hypothetical protein
MSDIVCADPAISLSCRAIAVRRTASLSPAYAPGIRLFSHDIARDIARMNDRNKSAMMRPSIAFRM